MRNAKLNSSFERPSKKISLAASLDMPASLPIIKTIDEGNSSNEGSAERLSLEVRKAMDETTR